MTAPAGAQQLAAYGLVVWAPALAPMATVSALRETSGPEAEVPGYLVSMKVSSESSRASHHFVWCTGACTPVTGDTCEWSR